MTSTSLHRSLESIRLADPAFWASGEDHRNAAFAALRAEDPIRFFEEPKPLAPGLPQGPGFWALTRYDDVWAASRNPEIFSSSQGTAINDLPEFLLETLGGMLNMDDPKHFRLRSLIAKGFAPTQIAKTEGFVREAARDVVDQMLDAHPGGSCDLVQALSAPFPLRVICRMMGIPEEDEPLICEWTNTILGVGDREFVATFDDLSGALTDCARYFNELGRLRLAEPRDDITSVLMGASIDGERLTIAEFASFMILLTVAGNETTRTAISHGVKLLTDHPQQRDDWFANWDDVIGNAIEEIVRYSTPVIHFRRTAAVDTELSGVKIAAGEKVALWYSSANRDETKWDDANLFDVRRPTDPRHLAFGGGGPHFCLGANLARRELTVIFDEIRRRFPSLHATAEPDYLKSSFIHGIKRLPCAW